MKVICDVCGTTFPETATHCPICGCAKSPVAQTVAGDDMQMNQESSTMSDVIAAIGLLEAVIPTIGIARTTIPRVIRA